jgi:inner membrane protein
MDPVCHTLVGGALAQTGLKRRTALGAATLLVAANLPDIDVLAYIDGPTTALWFRRGWTHGVLAWLVLPLLLTGVMVAIDRLWRRRRGGEPARPAALLALAGLGVLTHPVLDLLNTYGIRLLMPFSDRWFYGDTLFIVDPWVWAMLVAGIVVSRRRERAGRVSAAGAPAVIALVLLVAYVGTMTALSELGERKVRKAALDAGLGEPAHIMVAPMPANPLRRWAVAEIDEEYYVSPLPQPFAGAALQPVGLSRAPEGRAVVATRGPRARQFLSWARFPYFVVRSIDGAPTVVIGDARYTLEPVGSWASVTVPLAAPPEP